MFFKISRSVFSSYLSVSIETLSLFVYPSTSVSVCVAFLLFPLYLSATQRYYSYVSSRAHACARISILLRIFVRIFSHFHARIHSQCISLYSCAHDAVCICVLLICMYVNICMYQCVCCVLYVHVRVVCLVCACTCCMCMHVLYVVLYVHARVCCVGSPIGFPSARPLLRQCRRNGPNRLLVPPPTRHPTSTRAPLASAEPRIRDLPQESCLPIRSCMLRSPPTPPDRDSQLP